MYDYFNTLDSPLLISDDGRILDGYSWLKNGIETDQVKSALRRGELLKVDSEGNIIYDSNEVPEEPDIDPGEPLLPENANKKRR